MSRFKFNDHTLYCVYRFGGVLIVALNNLQKHSPTSGTAMEVDGTISATISWKKLSESKIVIPKYRHQHQFRLY